MTGSIVPTARTRAIAARMTQLAAHGDHDQALALLRELGRGQQVALVVALLGLTSGRGSHTRPGPVPVPTCEPPSVNLIACGTCGALLHESCKTRGGYSRADHPGRLMARRCPCGAPIPKKRGQVWCDPCAEASRKANQQRYDQARRSA